MIRPASRRKPADAVSPIANSVPSNVIYIVVALSVFIRARFVPKFGLAVPVEKAS
ncbi:hypothetical protein [Saccharopolyspora phatthalungensis]|uniref:hypothetical protein n=1 Tax=Saccharopolyspora phatthalungensis TaxID=664693 RepID=UPI00160E787A|nr:hypothetical protein [Saccharopolyspora phatthalungensis]